MQHILHETVATGSLADNFRLLNNVPIRLGVMSTIGPVRLSRFLAKFKTDHRCVEIAVSESGGADLKTRLDGGDLDLAVLDSMEQVRDWACTGFVPVRSACWVAHLSKATGDFQPTDECLGRGLSEPSLYSKRAIST